jgi:hypothetical protein
MNTNIKQIAQDLQGYGRNGDTMLAHITPKEAQVLSLLGGSGTINPNTGLPEFFSFGGFIGDALGSVADVVGDVGGFIGDTVGGVVDTAGAFIKDPVDFTGNFIENALANPAKTAASAALAYFGMPYITEALGGAYALPYTEAFDAANLASQGLDAAAIAQNISATGLDSFLAADIANLASQGLAADQISQVLAYSYTPSELAGTGIKSLATGVNQGSNLTDIAKQALKANQAVGSLLSGQQVNPLQPMQSGAGGQIKRAGVDYSPTLNLLQSPRASTPNIYSLLG